jgi:hypothetical protein
MNRLITGILTGLILLTSPVWAAAPQPIAVPGTQVAGIALGAADSVLKSPLSGLKLTTSGKDTEYEGQTVYYFFFGPKDANNNYPLQVYSDVNHKVFIFEINDGRFRTPEGIGVGSPEAALLKAYGPKLKKQQRGNIYTRYSMGTGKGPDFYVRQGKVSQMLIRAY